ncbi:MAG: response regulator transcription factor [Bacteroidota bacterium]
MNTRSNTPKIIVIDDNPTMENLLKGLLEANYEVSVFENGLAALAYMQQGNIPDLIISDLNTPLLDGHELLVQLKASSYFQSIPVIMLTAEDSSDIKIKCLKAGAEDFIVKPFNPFELDARIGLVLKRYGKEAVAA